MVGNLITLIIVQYTAIGWVGPADTLATTHIYSIKRLRKQMIVEVGSTTDTAFKPDSSVHS